MTLGKQSLSGSIDPSEILSIPESKIKPDPLATTGITAIIPAFNEAGQIAGVLDVLRQVDYLNEVIVVDDGSKDATSTVVLTLTGADGRLRLIRHSNNQGKGQAAMTGWRAAKSSFLLMLDADLVHLTPQHVLDLVKPVIEDQADMTLGLFRGGRWNTDLAHFVTPWLTGQRCLRSELFALVSARAAAGYGLETALTVAAQQYSWRCKRVILRGVTHPASETHRGFFPGLWNRAKMYLTIAEAWYLAGGVRQVVRRPSPKKRRIRETAE